MKNILVTGSSCYLGSEFINFYTFSLLKSSINGLKLDNIDCVLHCAALVHQTKELDYKEYHNVNVAYTLNLVKKAKSKGVSHFVFISTIAAYDSYVKELSELTKKSHQHFMVKVN